MQHLNDIWAPLTLLPVLLIATMMWLAGARWCWVKKGEDLKPPLSPQHIIIALLFFLLLYNVCPLVQSVVAMKLADNIDMRLTANIIIQAIFLVGALFYSRQYFSITKFSPLFKTLIFGVGSFLVLVPIMYLAFDINSDIYHSISQRVDIHPTVTQLKDNADNATLFVLITINTALMAPIIEEVIYRGYFQPATTSLMGVHWGILAQSLLFTLHHPAGTYLPIFVFAIALSYVRQWSGSLIPCIVMHICLNGNTIYNIYQEAQTS